MPLNIWKRYIGDNSARLDFDKCWRLRGQIPKIIAAIPVADVDMEWINIISGYLDFTILVTANPAVPLFKFVEYMLLPLNALQYKDLWILFFLHRLLHRYRVTLQRVLSLLRLFSIPGNRKKLFYWIIIANWKGIVELLKSENYPFIS